MPTREEMRTEAISRMKKLHLMDECITAFKEGNVWSSEYMGALYELNKEYQAIVDEFEKEYEALVYHVVISYTEIGVLFSMLFVSKYADEWELDNEDISDPYCLCPCVMCKNLDDDICSDMGSIQVKPMNGGLVRIA